MRIAIVDQRGAVVAVSGGAREARAVLREGAIRIRQYYAGPPSRSQ
ncbi:MAG: hypothetical protein ACYTEX_17240 [Planctomycetota bacterium]